MTPTEQFAAAYWRWLRRLDHDEPIPELFGIEDQPAEILARQCHIEFERSAVSKAMAEKPQRPGSQRKLL